MSLVSRLFMYFNLINSFPFPFWSRVLTARVSSCLVQSSPQQGHCMYTRVISWSLLWLFGLTHVSCSNIIIPASFWAPGASVCDEHWEIKLPYPSPFPLPFPYPSPASLPFPICTVPLALEVSFWTSVASICDEHWGNLFSLPFCFPSLPFLPFIFLPFPSPYV